MGVYRVCWIVNPSAAGAITAATAATAVFVSTDGLWAPESWRISRDLLILVDETAKAVAPSDLVDLVWRAAEEWARGSSLIQGAVWPMIVVMTFELAQYDGCASLIDDQEAVE
jgi:hypothetical protein